MIEVSTALAIQLVDCVAAFAEVEPQPVCGKFIPQADLIGAQIVIEKICQQISRAP